MSHEVRPSRTKPDAAGLVIKHLPDTVTRLDERAAILDDLADQRTGEQTRHPDRFLAWVPSDSRLGRGYLLTVTWHKPTTDAPHGYVTAAHYGEGCPAWDNGQPCWHLSCAVMAVVRDFGHLVRLDPDGKVPERARPVALAPPGDRPAPAPERRRTGTDAGWYD